MKHPVYIMLVLVALLLMAGSSCIKSYDIPAITSVNNFLVVEGYLNATRDSPTVISLTRTRSLSDTILPVPETQAVVSIQSENGEEIFFSSRQNGDYRFNPVSFQQGVGYRVRIETPDANVYLSDFVDVKQTPTIDSLSWKRDGDDVVIMVNSVDPANNTRYYRWDHIETWQYHAFHETFIGYKDGRLYFRDSADMVYTCYDSQQSSDIVTGTSVMLTNDIISSQPVAKIRNGSKKLSVRYSILVKQYALTEEAHSYWQILQKSSQELGSIFDAQPAQLRGNISCITNELLPVIGFISAGTVSEKRLFITNRVVQPWNVDNTGVICEFKVTNTDSTEYYMADGSYSPAFYLSDTVFAMLRTDCTDCRTDGGVTEKPLFW